MDDPSNASVLRSLVTILVALLSGAALFARMGREDRQRAEAKWHDNRDDIDQVYAEELLDTLRRIVSDHAGRDLRDADLNRTFTGDLRIPPGELYGIYENVETEFGITIDKADEAELQSVTALARHIMAHLEASQRKRMLTGR